MAALGSALLDHVPRGLWRPLCIRTHSDTHGSSALGVDLGEQATSFVAQVPNSKEVSSVKARYSPTYFVFVELGVSCELPNSERVERCWSALLPSGGRSPS